MASPCLDTSLVVSPCRARGKDSSFFILSTSCLKIRVIYCVRLELLVRRWLFFSSRERSLSILLMGIPSFRNSSTTSCLYACWAKGSVLSWRVFSQLSVSVIVCSFNFDFLLRSFDLTCFCDAQCNLMTLFLDDKISLQASQKMFVPLTIRSWSGNWLIRSCKETFFVSLVPLMLYFPFVFCREPSLAISAGSGLL